jgi:hypothetical protein
MEKISRLDLIVVYREASPHFTQNIQYFYFKLVIVIYDYYMSLLCY